MNISEAIKERRSIRSFQDKPVPRQTLREILQLATRAPSATNTQPWEFTVVTGDVLNKIRAGNITALQVHGAHSSDKTSRYQDVYKQRRIDLAKQIFKLMAIERTDKQKRDEWMQRGFCFFDAPAAIILTMDRSLEGTWAVFDLGVITQTICLAAMNFGLGTCIETQGVLFPDVIKQHTDMPESKEIIMSIAIGYPKEGAIINTLKTDREGLENITTWLGYTD